jgi:hypothetical protein
MYDYIYHSRYILTTNRGLVKRRAQTEISLLRLLWQDKITSAIGLVVLLEDAIKKRKKRKKEESTSLCYIFRDNR